MMLFWNFCLNCKPCSGIFAENGDPIGRHVPDWSDMEVPPLPRNQMAIRQNIFVLKII